MVAANTSLSQIIKSARVKSVLKGQILLYEGDIAHEVYVVKSGIVKVYDIDEQGNEKILHLLKAPGLFPFMFFSGEAKGLRWFYAALTDCELYPLPAPELHETMQRDPKLTIELMNWFSKEMHELFERLSSLGKTNTSDKLIAALKFLAVCHGNRRTLGWVRLTFPVSHQLLADMMGVSRESVTLAMKDLQQARTVRSPNLKTMEIHLQRLVDFSPIHVSTS